LVGTDESPLADRANDKSGMNTNDFNYGQTVRYSRPVDRDAADFA